MLCCVWVRVILYMHACIHACVPNISTAVGGRCWGWQRRHEALNMLIVLQRAANCTPVRGAVNAAADAVGTLRISEMHADLCTVTQPATWCSTNTQTNVQLPAVAHIADVSMMDAPWRIPSLLGIGDRGANSHAATLDDLARHRLCKNPLSHRLACCASNARRVPDIAAKGPAHRCNGAVPEGIGGTIGEWRRKSMRRTQYNAALCCAQGASASYTIRERDESIASLGTTTWATRANAHCLMPLKPGPRRSHCPRKRRRQRPF